VPRKKRCILGHLYGQGYRQYTAQIGGFGSSSGDNYTRHHINILLVDIQGVDGLYLDHCWSRYRPKWQGIERGDVVRFEAKVGKYSGGFKLARFRNIEIVGR
jgi:hypothetical protein